MRILIAEDDPVTARLLTGLIASWDYEIIAASDGESALDILGQQDTSPQLAILDWMMPRLDGPDVCRRIREQRAGAPCYLILLTSKSDRADVVAGLEAGADDYLVKPVDPQELRARLNTGARIVTLQQQLATHVRELQEALANVRQLSGLLPICSYCKSIRDDSNYWHRVEEYLSKHSDVHFSHGICPKCFDTAAKQLMEG